MSAGGGSVGREQSDPVPLQSNVMSGWSLLNRQHLFHRASTRVVFIQRNGGAAVGIQSQSVPPRLWASSPSQESTSNKTIDCQRMHVSSRGSLCLVSLSLLDPRQWWLSWPEAQPVNLLVWNVTQCLTTSAARWSFLQPVNLDCVWNWLTLHKNQNEKTVKRSQKKQSLVCRW